MWIIITSVNEACAMLHRPYRASDFLTSRQMTILWAIHSQSTRNARFRPLLHFNA